MNFGYIVLLIVYIKRSFLVEKDKNRDYRKSDSLH